MDLNNIKKFIFLFFLIGICFSQKNNIYAELGGAGYLRTFNYERMLTDNIIARFGFGFEKNQNESGYSDNEFLRFYPLGTAYLFGAGEHRLEIGGGLTLLDGTLEMNGDVIEENQSTLFIGSGYRYNQVSGGLLFCVKGYYLSLGKFSAPWFGISLGWTF